ncbi:acyl carrier protein [Nonomuraea sp. NPDC046802]|uniref:acyl carrier protein n=1 Tax=Nonomuraea sp. NPDC046802 TaxID=3154919 RepID=UPI00340BC7C7
MSVVAVKISEFLSCHVGPTEYEADLFETGQVSSLFALQLVMFVESEFAVAVEDEDLDLANFRSVAAIESFVLRKLGE